MGKRKLREIEEKYGKNKECLNNTEDALKTQKKMNKYLKVWNHMKKHMITKAHTKDHKT